MNLTLAIGFVAVLPVASWAFEPQFEGAPQPVWQEDVVDSHLPLPVGPFSEGAIAYEDIAGAVLRRSWRITQGFSSTTALANTLRDQMENAGYSILFKCSDAACGGFDFRFALDVLLPPNMFVDLSNYVFFSVAQDTAEGRRGGWVVVSQTAQVATVQINLVSPVAQLNTAELRPQSPQSAALETTDTEAEDRAESVARASVNTGAIVESMLANGFAILNDLAFDTGAAQLSAREYGSLSQLATYLKENAARRIALVGHTDNEGSLSANVRLSERRAAAVAEKLVAQYGVSKAQVEAKGAGYLSPIATNQTKEGRQKNRRVEAVVLSTE